MNMSFHESLKVIGTLLLFMSAMGFILFADLLFG